MPLTLRPTGLSSPAYADKLDYVVCEDGKVIGRIYEDWHTLPDLRWFWSITVYVDPRQGINTSGRAASLRLKRNSFRTGRGAAPTRLHPHSALPTVVLRFRGSNHIHASINLVLRSALLRASRRTATSDTEPAAILRDGASRLLRMRSVCV